MPKRSTTMQNHWAQSRKKRTHRNYYGEKNREKLLKSSVFATEKWHRFKIFYTVLDKNKHKVERNCNETCTYLHCKLAVNDVSMVVTPSSLSSSCSSSFFFLRHYYSYFYYFLPPFPFLHLFHVYVQSFYAFLLWCVCAFTTCFVLFDTLLFSTDGMHS